MVMEPAPLRALLEVDYDVIGTPRKYRFRRLVVRVPFDVIEVGWHEEEFSGAGLDVLFEILAIIDPDMSLDDIGGGLGLAMVMGRSHGVGSTFHLAQPYLAGPGGVAVYTRSPDHAVGLRGGPRGSRLFN